LKPDQQVSYLDKIVYGLNPDGVFVLIYDAKGEAGGEYPMHYGVDHKAIENRLLAHKMSKVQGSGYATLWRKP
jgi:hypothetical protein